MSGNGIYTINDIDTCEEHVEVLTFQSIVCTLLIHSVGIVYILGFIIAYENSKYITL